MSRPAILLATLAFLAATAASAQESGGVQPGGQFEFFRLHAFGLNAQHLTQRDGPRRRLERRHAQDAALQNQRRFLGYSTPIGRQHTAHA